MCWKNTSNSQPYVVLVKYAGVEFAVIPDTGSSNLVVASERCGKDCDVTPRWRAKATGKNEGAEFRIKYGTGGAVVQQTSVAVEFGGLRLPAATVGAITAQDAGTDGFNLFPARSDPLCHNSYAGVFGLAYQGQSAGPAESQTAGGTTNGTTVPLLDQFVAAGLPNVFSIELCARYPEPCAATNTSTWAPSERFPPGCDARTPVGALALGGHRSRALRSPLRFTPLRDEIHYDVELRGIEVCGDAGCRRVAFPDAIGGVSEDACVCATPDCAVPLHVPDEYCYFAVVDSGADGIFLNTVNNTVALLEAMAAAEMVRFLPGTARATVADFYAGRVAVSGAAPAPRAALRVFFPDAEDSQAREFPVPVEVDALFLRSEDGLRQTAVRGDLDAAAAFQSAKFPVLIGSPLLRGKVTVFDRAAKRLGFAAADEAVCGAVSGPGAAPVDVRGASSAPTPGSGCRRGTGSGGGCPQPAKPSIPATGAALFV